MFTKKYPQPWVSRFKSDSEMITYCKKKEEEHQCLYKDCTIDSDNSSMCETHQKAITNIVKQIINFIKTNFKTWLLDWSRQALKDKSLYPTRICQDISSQNILEYAGDDDLLFQYFILNFGDFALEDPEQFAYDCVTFENSEQEACIYELLDRPFDLDCSDNNDYIKFLINAMLHRKALDDLTLDYDKPDKPERILERLIQKYNEMDDNDWIDADDSGVNDDSST